MIPPVKRKLKCHYYCVIPGNAARQDACQYVGHTT